MFEQSTYNIVGFIVLMFVVPTLVWVLLAILRIKMDIAVIKSEINIRTQQSAEHYKETSAKFDKFEHMLTRIEMGQNDLREKFISHNGWERERAARQNGKSQHEGE